MALFTAGILISSADKVYASFLPAAGTTILYLTCFAAYQYYLLISFQTVIAITSIISWLSIWFYLRFKHDIYAIIASIGAYIAPVISSIDTNAIFSLYYFIICSLTFATLAIWVQSRTLTIISAYLAISITALIGLNLDQDNLIAIAFLRHRQELAQKDEYSYALLAGAHLLCIMALYQLTINYGFLAISSSWLLYALIVLGFAFIRNDILMAKSVLIVLSFAAGKALIHDASSTPTIIRTLCLILTGVVLYHQENDAME